MSLLNLNDLSTELSTNRFDSEPESYTQDEVVALKAVQSEPVAFSPWPSYSEEEADAVKDMVLSNKVNYWTGNNVKSFETAFAQYIGATKSIGVTNGTLALDLILNNLPIDNRSEIIVTPRTYIASVSSIVMAGYKPVFVDIDPDSQNLDVESTARAINRKTKAIMAVHLAGWPCEMDALSQLCSDHSLYLIEDCAQAHGAKFNNQSVGSFGAASAWSFCQEKIMTTGGEGGMVTTLDEDLYEKMWSYKEHGKNRDAVFNQEHAPGFRWLHESFGSNFRMLEYQAVIGQLQLAKLAGWVDSRRQNAQRIWQAGSGIAGLRVPEVPKHIDHAAYKCYLFVEPTQLKSSWSRDRILQEIGYRGVPVFSGSCPEVYLEKVFQKTGFAPSKRLPVAQELGETSIMFMVHPTLTESEITQTCNALTEVMALAVK